MFRHETSMRKPFFSKATQLKKNFSIYFFLENFEKMSRKKKTKTFRKIINSFDEYFYRYALKVDKTYFQISFKTIIFKML